MAGPTIKGDLQFDGYTQTNVEGTGNQVLTYSSGKAIWQDAQGGAPQPNQLPCFFLYFQGIQIFVPANLYIDGGELEARTFDYDADEDTFSYSDNKDLGILSNAIGTRTFDFDPDAMPPASAYSANKPINLRV